IVAPFEVLGGGPHRPAEAHAATPPPAITPRADEPQSLATVARANAHPFQTVAGFGGAVPILLYHVIHAAPPGVPNPGLYVPVHELKHQLDWLDRHGFEAVTLDQVFKAWNDGAPIAAKPIVISFDDGYATQYRRAAPLLAAHGWPGVLNLKVDAVLQHELTEDMVTEMIAAGWEVDAHTITHPDVTTLDAAGLRQEIGGSREYLQQHFGVPVNFFCYPSGAYNDAAVAAVQAAGYLGATTTEEGLADQREPFTLSRVRIEPGDGEAGLQQKLLAAGAAAERRARR
ncbi:MAG: hypothetical protein QOF76_4504, partial [Solirubrobacteraceae bacterium]|nr:hypothetical protein [Solirubrobacteraceae bacterium]